MDPKVSIIIVNYNGKEDTLECLDSVHKINYPNYEVIVVDNGSSDGSVEAVKAGYPSVFLIRNEKNTGFCVANNLGIRLACGHGAEFLFVLNNDTIVKPTVIDELKKVLDSDKKIGCVCPLIAYYQKQEVLQYAGMKMDWGNGDMYGHYRRQEEFSGVPYLETYLATWCAVLIRRESLDSVGFLDEQFFAYYEDIDWSQRCAEAGLKRALYPKVLVFHKGSRSTGGIYSPLVYYYLFRNKFIFMRKHADILRKTQFSFNYVSDSLKKYAQLLNENKLEEALAVADALWSALMGCRFVERIAMPQRFKSKLDFFVKARLCFLSLKAVFSPDTTAGTNNTKKVKN